MGASRGSASLQLVWLWGCILCLLAACSPLAVAPTPGAASLPLASPSPRPTLVPAITTIPEVETSPEALVIWAVVTAPQLEALQRLMAELSHQIGTEVMVVGKSADSLQADLRSNALIGLPLPDLMLGSQDDLGLLQREGLLQPADDRLADADFIAATIEGATIGGQRWGTPIAAQGFMLLLYNRRLIDAPPRTTDELIARSRQLTADEHYGLVAGWAEPRWFAAWLAGFGGAALGRDGAPTLDTPQTIAALNLLKELRPSGPPPPSTYLDGAQLFKQGQAALAIDGDWALAEYRRYTETLDLGIAPLPLVPATGRVAAPPLDGIYLLYAKALSGERLTSAYALAHALTQPAQQARIAHDLAWLPALRASGSDPAVQAIPELAAAAAQSDGAVGLPPIENLRCAWSAIQADLPALLLGEVSQEETARSMQLQATSCITTAGS